MRRASRVFFTFATFEYIFSQKKNSGAGDVTADAVTYAHKSVIAAVYTHAKPNSTSIAWINTPTQKRGGHKFLVLREGGSYSFFGVVPFAPGPPPALIMNGPLT